jgi:hypothetical protein
MQRINGCKVIDEEDIHRSAPVGALFLASSKLEVEQINRQAHAHLIKQGKEALVIWAHHKRGRNNANFDLTARIHALEKCPANTSEQYYKWLGTCRNKIHLCVGSRVRYLLNKCPIAGLFQGAMGTVVGFGLPIGRKAEDYNRGMSLELAARFNREVPLVYVKMDMADGFESAWVDTPGVICFAAEQTPTSGSGHPRFMLPLLPAHARTYHAAQGLTAAFGVVLYRPVKRMFALMYVGISRIKTLASLFLMQRVVAEDFQSGTESFANVELELVRLRGLKNQL